MKRKELVKKLELVKPALATNNLIPVFTCFMFEDGKQISAYNNELGIRVAFEGDPGTFAVAGETLLGLLGNSQAEEVEFVISDQLEVKAGKSRFKLPYFEKDEFLFEEPTGDWETQIGITQDFLKGIETCLITASADNSMPALMGVTLDLTQTTRLYSCDGDAVTRYDTDAPASEFGKYMLTNTFCIAMLSLCEEVGIGPASMLHLNSQFARLMLDGAVLYGRMLVNEKPLDHAHLIKTTLKDEAVFVPIPKGFDEALARARVLSDVESSETALTISGSKLNLLTSTRMGTIKDELNIKGHGNVSARIHASLISRAVNACESISIRENCTAFKAGDAVLQVVSNVG